MKMELPIHINHLGKHTNFEMINNVSEIIRLLWKPLLNILDIWPRQILLYPSTHNTKFYVFWLKNKIVSFHRNHPNSSNNRLRTASLSTSDEGIVMDYRDDTPRKRRVSTHSDNFFCSIFGLSFFLRQEKEVKWIMHIMACIPLINSGS